MFRGVRIRLFGSSLEAHAVDRRRLTIKYIIFLKRILFNKGTSCSLSIILISTIYFQNYLYLPTIYHLPALQTNSVVGHCPGRKIKIIPGEVIDE